MITLGAKARFPASHGTTSLLAVPSYGVVSSQQPSTYAITAELAFLKLA